MNKIIKKASKYVVFSLAFMMLPMEIGAIHGEEEYPYDAIEYDGRIIDSAIMSSAPIVIKGIFTKPVIITAYSSRPEETDDTPFVTASNTRVRPGIVAANWLPFGTRIRIPELFGDRIFIVEDRMHRRNSHKLDIWFEKTSDAINFGIKKAKIEIL